MTSPASLRLLRCVIVLGLFMAILGGCASPTVEVTHQGPPLSEAPVLDPRAAQAAINAYRAKHGLNPLLLDARLDTAADAQARDLAKRDLLDHTGSDGSSPWQRVVRVGYKPAMTAENIAAGQKSFAEVLTDWENSPEHNRNLLLPDAGAMGIALAFNPNTRFRSFWALELAAPAGTRQARAAKPAHDTPRPQPN